MCESPAAPFIIFLWLRLCLGHLRCLPSATSSWSSCTCPGRDSQQTPPRAWRAQPPGLLSRADWLPGGEAPPPRSEDPGPASRPFPALRRTPPWQGRASEVLGGSRGSWRRTRREDEVTHLRWRLGKKRISRCREAKATGVRGQASRHIAARSGRICALSVEICSRNWGPGRSESGAQGPVSCPRPGTAEAGSRIRSEGARGLGVSDLGPHWRRRRYLGNSLMIFSREVPGGVGTGDRKEGEKRFGVRNYRFRISCNQIALGSLLLFISFTVILGGSNRHGQEDEITKRSRPKFLLWQRVIALIIEK